MIFTLIFPLLICESVPTSNTGVFPVLFLSWRGPSFGRRSPYLAVSPIMKCDIKSSKRSTMWTGNHLSRHMHSSKVDLPSISWGRMCNCDKWKGRTSKEEIQINKKPRVYWKANRYKMVQNEPLSRALLLFRARKLPIYLYFLFL